MIFLIPAISHGLPGKREESRCLLFPNNYRGSCLRSPNMKWGVALAMRAALVLAAPFL
ncbi:hypothetical protein [Burkholderia stagnalis]